MADYQIFTPPRGPRENELVNNVIFQALNDKSTVSARIMFMDGNLAIQLFFVEPSIFVRYDFLNNKWLSNSGEPIDITTVDLTIPEDVVSVATTKTSYFDLIAFEKGTTACKLAAANDARLLIRNAIINEGVTIPDGTTFRQYAGLIKQIKAGNKAKIDVDTRPAFGTSVVYVEDGVRKSLEISVSGSFYADIGSVIEVLTEAYVRFDGGLTPLEESYSCTVNGDGTIHASTAV